MTLRCNFFAIPALAPDAAQQALNAFCAAHRVLTLDRHFVDQGTGSYWAVSVTWLDSCMDANMRAGAHRARWREPKARRAGIFRARS